MANRNKHKISFCGTGQYGDAKEHSEPVQESVSNAHGTDGELRKKMEVTTEIKIRGQMKEEGESS